MWLMQTIVNMLLVCTILITNWWLSEHVTKIGAFIIYKRVLPFLFLKLSMYVKLMWHQSGRTSQSKTCSRVLPNKTKYSHRWLSDVWLICSTIFKYACNTWLDGSLTKVENIETKYLKIFLGVKDNTCTFGISIDTGRFPVVIQLIKKELCFFQIKWRISY